MLPALICLSHLRWDFVYQRPNHLMARAARDRRVYFVEEPVPTAGEPTLESHDVDGVTVVRPLLPAHLGDSEREATLARLVRPLAGDGSGPAPWLWYYTPMALPWTQELEASAVVYDCMDQLSAFRGAPAELVELERALFARADVVFTGGRSLYEAKARQHPRVHAMPSAVEVDHFAQARRPRPEPADQAAIPRPRIGYYGVIDERLDLELVREVARARPDWQLVLVGPIAKLAPDEIPTAPNIHHLGLKSYAELPDYLHGWDVAMMPFALNEATRYISPTKTPEYLAGGTPVVSTAIRDVVHPYGDLGLVRIVETPGEFVAAVEQSLQDDTADLVARADGLLAEMSWDATWARMQGIVRAALRERGLQEAATPAAFPVPDAVPAPAGVPALASASASDRRPRGEPVPAGRGSATRLARAR